MLDDDTVLFAREYLDKTDRDYSFHWQDADGKLIVRWDNTRHHKRVKTYPHHKHVGEAVMESFEMSLVEVLGYIERYGKGN